MTNASNNTILLDRVSKRFGSVQALADVSVSLGGTGTTGVIGPNGSGKTTLVNIVTGVVKPTAGRVMWEGRPLNRLPTHRIVRRGIARTFQQAMTFPGLTVRENIVVSLEAAGRSQDDLHGVVDGESHFESLRGHMESRASDLPFGLARLLGIAVAMASRPRLLFLDEPAAGLNDVEGRALGATVRALSESGTAIVIIDHDMAFLLPLCKRVVVFDAGEIIADGTPTEVRADPAVIAVYLGQAFA